MKEFKAYLFAMFTFMIMVYTVPCKVQAAEFGYFSYEIINGEAVVKKYNYNDTLGNVSVFVPETLDGFPVTCIDRFAFADCRYLTSVALPRTITKIGDFAFANCRFLSRINLQDTGIKNIGARAFESCYTLTSISLPPSVKNIGFGAFRFSSISDISLPDGMKNISDNTFEGCRSMKIATLPDSIESIGVCTFAGCSGLETINAYPLSAPTTDSTSFAYVPSSVILYVKKGAEGYDMEPWIQWELVERDVAVKFIDLISGGNFISRNMTAYF